MSRVLSGVALGLGVTLLCWLAFMEVRKTMSSSIDQSASNQVSEQISKQISDIMGKDAAVPPTEEETKGDDQKLVEKSAEREEPKLEAPIQPSLEAVDGDVVKELIRQRDEVSRILNRRLAKLAQLTCECEKKDTSEGGAYCLKGIHRHRTDKRFIGYLKDKFKHKTIGSFGDGLGYYKQAVGPHVKGYDSYDGAPYTENKTDGRVNFLDLSVPQYGLPIYDIVMSTEVAEHIPAEFEPNFLGNICRHAREAIILSWGVPHQPGYAHVNNRPIQHVFDEMKKRGFELNDDETKKLKEGASFSWLKRNLYWYDRKVPIKEEFP